MRTQWLVAIVSLVLAQSASAFRDDLPSDPMDAIAHACAVDPSHVAEAIAESLGVHPLQVLKAIGRQTLGSLEKGDLCARSEEERRVVIAAARQPRKVRSPGASAAAEPAQEWLLRQLGGAEGVIDYQAVAKALEERALMLATPKPKRSGLPATPSGWTNLTGYTQSSGRINHVLFTSGTGTDILAAADGGGIWRTTDGGTTWAPVNDFLGSLSIANFAKANNDANTIYAATNAYGSHTYFPFGIVKSTNAGATWSQIAATNPSTNADFSNVQRVAVDPSNSQHVLAATNGGAYQSTDGGTTWTKVGGISIRAYFVAFHPTDANRAAIGYDDGTVRYTTTGDLLGAGAGTSTLVSPGRYIKVAYAKSDPTRMYALVTDSATYATRLFTSTTSGASWTEISNAALNSNGTFYNNGYLYYTGALWVDPLNAVRVAVCEGWCSFTADITAVTPVWKRLYSGWTDFHGIVEHPGYNPPGSNSIVFFMDDGGLYRIANIDALDSGANFARLENGMTVTQVYSVAGGGGNPIFGAQDVGPKVYKTDSSIGDNTPKWRLTARPPSDATCPGCFWIGDGMTAAASSANPLVLYGSRQYLDVFRSNDGGATATSIVYNSAVTEGRGVSAPNYNASFVAPFVLDPSNQSRMLAGGKSLWQSTNVDTGSPPAWTAIRAPYTDPSYCGGSQSPIGVIAIAPSNPDVVWIAYECSGRLFKSVNATQASPAWTEVTTLPVAATLRSKASIMIDRLNPNVVWVGLGQYQAGTLFRTNDGGATTGGWTTIAGLPGAPVNSLLQHPANTQWIYAGTSVGLFASDDGGATWSTSNEGPANVVVKSLDWNTTGSSSEMLVGTFGRGVFKATVTFTPPSNPPRLANISTRGQVQTGFDVMIGGFVINGAAPKTVVIRAIGPSLANYGVSGALSNPQIQLVRSSDQVTLAANDSWGSASNAGLISSSGFAPSNPVESAIYTTLQPGAYTAIVSGVGGVTGVGLIEVYEVDQPDTPLINISTRGRVQTGFDVMIGGFVIQGSGPETVVIRAIGPSLANFGVAGALANPQVQLVRQSDQAVIASNDDWVSAPNAALIQSSGFAPSNSLESAIYITLDPGAYTAIVSGVGGGTGVGLVEVYKVGP